MNHDLKNLGDVLLCCENVDSKIVEYDPDTLTARSFDQTQIEILAQSMANWLHTRGRGPHERIAIVAKNSIEWIVCYLAVLKIGAIAVLINPRSANDQIDHMINDSETVLVLTDTKLTTDRDTVDISSGFITALPPTKFVSYQPEYQQTAIILHTSGSTGKPKRVLISHQSRMALLKKDLSRYKVFFTTPLCHILALNCLEFSFYNKIDMLFLKTFQSSSYAKIIDREKPRRLVGVPSIFAMLVQYLDQNKIYDFSSVQSVTLAGDHCSQVLYKQLCKVFTNAKISIGYGSVELGPGIFGPHHTLPTPPFSLGCEKPEIDYRIVEGVLQVRSPYMMRGYDKHNNSFTEDGFYITNDIFEIDSNGFYYFVGRKDDMFKSGGNKIYPREIESVLQKHPDVDQCVVVPVTDAIKNYKPVAFVTLQKNTTTTETILQQFIQDKLTPFQIPKKIWILEEMPLTEIDKIDKIKLKSMAEKNFNT